MSNSPLVNVTVRAHSSNYTAGRGGYKINHITVHHMAGILTAAQCGNIFARAGRNGSAHYGVGSDGKVGLYVNESDRAWSDSNWQSNCTTVSIETSNSSTGGNWPVSDLTFNKLVELVADIARRNGLGTLVPGKNLTWHSMYAQTTCLPVDTTELLTPNGWVRLADVSEGDMVASYRLDDGSIVFTPVRSIVAPYLASTWEFRDVEATADHRMIWRTQNGEYKITSLSEMTKYLGPVYIPNAGHYDGVGIDLSDFELKYLVAIQADGHYMKDKGRPDKPYGIEFHFKKQRKIDLLIDALDELGKKYTLGDRADGTKVIRIYGQEEVAWAEKYLSDKQFTWKFLQMNDRQAEIFLDAVLDFDGCRAGNDYSSSIKHNVDVVQAIAAIHNIGTRWSKEGTRVHFTNRERSVCLQGKLSGSATRHQNQLVGCVTVDTGLILVRQHGRTTVVGNCPGDYLRGKMQELANRANAINNGEEFRPSYCDGFLPYPNGYWTKGDKNERIGVLSKWMRAKYPDFTPESALGDYYGDNIAGAIRRYQQLNGLEADGNTGPITYGSLKSNGFTYPNPVYPEKLTWAPMEEPRIMLTNDGAKLVNVETGEVVKTYSADVRIEFDQKTTYNGVLYLRTKYSSSKNINNGFASSDLHEVPAPEPTPEPEPEPEPTPEDPTVGILEKIIAFIKHIIDLITKKQGE